MADAKDRWHADALRLRPRLRGRLVVSDLGMAEAATILGKRKGGKAAALVCEFIQDNCRIEFLHAKALPEVMKEHLRYDGTLSVADAHAVWLMASLGVRDILSFDSDFDKVKGIRRIS
ncbi:MAG: type II toxin-antitoxin system VapC family toxin [Euryarchaeota archaeon]|nr:type II toxin-antitoxin system VapC family toxin [Euryarchaeota archaeon]